MTVSALIPRRRCEPPPRGRGVGSIRVSWLRVLGPAFAVSIGYIDPGNWATDLGAGAFGFRLLWVVLVANLIALVLQIAVSELTIASGEDFALAIVRRWPHARTLLWAIFAGAAVATDVSEFAGIVLGLQLLFHVSTMLAVALGVAIVFGILRASDATSKGLEIGAIAVLAIIAIACFAELPALHPAAGAVVRGMFVPSVPAGSIVVLVGIIGATVMPHNLFLHSALIRQASTARGDGSQSALAKIFGRETFVALNVAALVNIALVVIGAGVAGAHGSLTRAFASLAHNGSVGAILFGGGLLLSGIAASTTATAAGDRIFAAFATRPIPRLLRRALTLLPAAFLILAGTDIGAMLVWSQVALALILPVALVPLVFLLAQHVDAIRYGRLVIRVTVAMSVVCVAFDGVMLVQMLHG